MLVQNRPVEKPVKKSVAKWWLLGFAVAVVLAWPVGFWSALLIGKSALAASHWERANFWLDLSCTAWPWSYEANLESARAHRQLGQFTFAEGRLNQCLRVRGGASEDVQIEFLMMRAETGEADEASWHLMKYVDSEHPRSYELMQSLCRAYMHHLKYGPAYALLNRMVALDPDRAIGYYWRGWVLERMDNPGEAKLNYVKALELDPSITSVRLRLGEILMDDNRPDEAAPHLEELYAQMPDRADIQARMGQLRFLQGKWAEARPLLEKALPAMQDDSPLLLHLARLDLQEGRPTDAAAHLDRILAKDPTDTEAQFSLITAYQQLGKTELAKAAMKKYQEKKVTLDLANKMLKDEATNPSQSADVASEIGRLMKDIGRERLGLYWFEQALSRDPMHRPTHLLLAEHYAKAGDSKKAAYHRAKSGEKASEKSGEKISDSVKPTKISRLAPIADPVFPC